MSFREIMNAADKKRFEIKFVKSEGCWIWNAGISVYGYGWFRPHGTMECVNAHRVAYELYVGPIAEDLTVDHLCRVRSCVNPDHLEIVSRSENTRRSHPIQEKCVRGHFLEKPNLYIGSNGTRKCKSCHRIRTGFNLVSDGPGKREEVQV